MRRTTAIALACSLMVACAGPRRSGAHADVDARLAAQLVAWDLVRGRATSQLLVIPLPEIAVRGVAIVGSTAVNASAATVTVPRMSPHYATVQMEWPTICERRGLLADDVFAYAMAWCRYARDGKGDLESVLVALMTTSVPGLRAAVLADLVQVVAHRHDAATAMRILDQVSAPPGTLDTLAAIYAGLGHTEDEAVVRARLPPPVRSAMQPDCSELDDALETFVPLSVTRIRHVAAGASSCAAPARTLLCRIAAVSGGTARVPACVLPLGLRDDAAEVREAHYLAAYAHWGTDWFTVVDHAMAAMPEPGAEQVALAALSASLRVDCTAARLQRVQDQAQQLGRHPAHEARWTTSVRALSTITPKLCNKLVAVRASS